MPQASLNAGTDPASGETLAQDDEATPTRTTWLLVAMWVAVYAAMTVVQGGFRTETGMLGPGVILTPVAHDFGTLSAREVADGQVWRTITATFIHLSLLHLVCNLSCLIAFGRLLNSWYGGPQFFLLYLVIAAVGNALAVGGRYLLRGGLDTHCAGGSSVMFGLIALIAVVGWRSKTRFGNYVRREMVSKLFFFGVVMGIVGRNVLDNYGHAGGAIAGALAGFTHRYLIRCFDRPVARATAFALSAVIVAACVVAQWKVGRADYLDRRAMLVSEMASVLDFVAIRYNQMETILERERGPLRTDPTLPIRQQIGAALLRIDRLHELGAPVGDPAQFKRWHALAESAVARLPIDREIHEYRRLQREMRSDLHDELAGLPTPRPAREIGRR